MERGVFEVCGEKGETGVCGVVGSLGTMGVLVDVRGVLVSGGLHKWSGLGVVGALVSGARTVLGGWVVLGQAVGALEDGVKLGS